MTRMPAALTLPHACVPRRMLIMHARRLFDLARSYSIGNWYLIDLGYAIRFLDTRSTGTGIAGRVSSTRRHPIYEY